MGKVEISVHPIKNCSAENYGQEYLQCAVDGLSIFQFLIDIYTAKIP